MKIQRILAAVTISLCFLVVYAHPPQGISISADFDKNQLHIAIKHVKNSSGDYIRKVEVLVDEKGPIEKVFHFQIGSYRKLSLTIPGLEDVKRVVIRAYPKQGRFLEKDFDMQSLQGIAETE